MTHKSGFLKSLAIMTAVTGILVLVLEAGSRLFLWQPAMEGNLGHIRYGFTPNGLGDLHPGQDGVYTAHPELPYHVVSNRDGFRNRQQVQPDMPTILALGDSQTFGLFTHAHDIWTDWLQFYLRRDKPKLQILNNGIPGASIQDALDYYRTKGVRLKPDLVLLCVYVNDVADLRSTDTIRAQGISMEQQVRFSDLRWFLRQHSALYDMAKSVRDALTRTEIQARNNAVPVNSPDARLAQNSFKTASLPFDKYEALFVEFLNLVNDNGAGLAVAYLPGPNTAEANAEIGAFITQLAARHNLPFLDLSPSLATRPVDEVYLTRDGDGDYPSDIHLSRSGHMLIAKALAPFVATHIK